MIIQKHKATFHESCCAEEKMNVLATTSPHFTYQHFFLYKRKEKKKIILQVQTLHKTYPVLCHG
jgi:hypothetical protein